MLRVAIVGNIASGKSCVEEILIKKGFEVYDADKIAHKLLENNPDAERVFGTTDRKSIGNIVFNNPEKLKELENILHPLVKQEIENLKGDVVFVSVPLLFEANFTDLFDKIVFVSASENIRLERLMKRNNLTKEDALLRIRAQLPEEEKIKKSDFVIKNESDFEDLKKQVEELITNLNL